MPTMETPQQGSECTSEHKLIGREFGARHTTDGRFNSVDQRAALVIGYLPHELVGSSVYDHVQYDDIPEISKSHTATLRGLDETGNIERKHINSCVNVAVGPFRFRCKGGSLIYLEGSWRQFRNPWTKEIEYIVARYVVCDISRPNNKSIGSSPAIQAFASAASAETITLTEATANIDTNNTLISAPLFVHDGAPCSVQNTPSTGTTTFGNGMQRVISDHAEASKIGLQQDYEVIKPGTHRETGHNYGDKSGAQESNSMKYASKTPMVQLPFGQQHSEDSKNNGSRHSAGQSTLKTFYTNSSRVALRDQMLIPEGANGLPCDTIDTHELLLSEIPISLHSSESDTAGLNINNQHNRSSTSNTYDLEQSQEQYSSDCGAATSTSKNKDISGSRHAQMWSVANSPIHCVRVLDSENKILQTKPSPSPSFGENLASSSDSRKRHHHRQNDNLSRGSYIMGDVQAQIPITQTDGSTSTSRSQLAPPTLTSAQTISDICNGASSSIGETLPDLSAYPNECHETSNDDEPSIDFIMSLLESGV